MAFLEQKLAALEGGIAAVMTALGHRRLKYCLAYPSQILVSYRCFEQPLRRHVQFAEFKAAKAGNYNHVVDPVGIFIR